MQWLTSSPISPARYRREEADNSYSSFLLVVHIDRKKELDLRKRHSILELLSLSQAEE